MTLGDSSVSMRRSSFCEASSPWPAICFSSALHMMALPRAKVEVDGSAATARKAARAPLALSFLSYRSCAHKVSLIPCNASI